MTEKTVCVTAAARRIDPSRRHWVQSVHPIITAIVPSMIGWNRVPSRLETPSQSRLRGKGAPSLRGTARGDHYVETRIATPRTAGDRARRLLEELGGLESGEDLRRDLWK